MNQSRTTEHKEHWTRVFSSIKLGSYSGYNIWGLFKLEDSMFLGRKDFKCVLIAIWRLIIIMNPLIILTNIKQHLDSQHTDKQSNDSPGTLGSTSH